VAVGVVSFFTLRPSQPAYGDKPLTGWVEQLFTFTNYSRVDAEARDALRAMGQPAVRFLTRRLDHAPSAWRLRLASMTEDIPFINRLFGVATFDRLFAAKALAEIGPTAKSAIPALERATKDADDSLSVAARAALIRIREESIDSHVAIYRQFETKTSSQTVFLLMELGQYARPALPAMLEGMQSTNDRVRSLAVMALPMIGYEFPEYVPPLQRLLSDPSEMVRWQALNSLAHFGPLAKAALPQARQFLHDTNSLVRASALRFLYQVLSDEEFSTVRDEVVQATQDADSTVSGMAQSVLSTRPRGKPQDVPSR
jgi:HEAT repeat protein